MKRKTTLKRKTALKRMHPETEKNVRAYLVFKNAYLRSHPYCEIQDCMRLAGQIHHLAGHGYRGNRLCDERYLQAICLEHHRWIHDHPNLARKKKLLLDQ